MIISSGWCKGLKILTPEGLDTRPTRSRVREAVVSMIQTSIEGATVLDLFAGSGAVGLELVSRGAKSAVFVESSNVAKRALSVNKEAVINRAKKQQLELPPLDMCIKDVLTIGDEFHAKKFDIIWADPPYEIASQFLDSAASWLPYSLNADGLFVLESGQDVAKELEGVAEEFKLELWKQRSYGVTLISIWRQKEGAES